MTTASALDPFTPSGLPLHTRTLVIEAFQHEGGRVRLDGVILDLRKVGFVPTGGELQTAGFIHHMNLRVELDPATAPAVRARFWRSPRREDLSQRAGGSQVHGGWGGGRTSGCCAAAQRRATSLYLVPGLAHPRYAELQPIVRQACERHGYLYRVLGWGEALRRALAVIRTPKSVVEPAALAVEVGG